MKRYQTMLVHYTFFGAYLVGLLIYFMNAAATIDSFAKMIENGGAVIGLLVSGVGSALSRPALVKEINPAWPAKNRLNFRRPVFTGWKLDDAGNLVTSLNPKSARWLVPAAISH